MKSAAPKSATPRQFLPVWKVAALAAITGLFIRMTSENYLMANWWILPTLIGVAVVLPLTILFFHLLKKKQFKNGNVFLQVFKNYTLPFLAKNVMLGVCLVAMAIQAFNYVPVREQMQGDFFLLDKYKVRDQKSETYHFVVQSFQGNLNRIIPENIYRKFERGDVVPVVIQPGMFGGEYIKSIGHEVNEESPGAQKSTHE